MPINKNSLLTLQDSRKCVADTKLKKNEIGKIHI